MQQKWYRARSLLRGKLIVHCDSLSVVLDDTGRDDIFSTQSPIRRRIERLIFALGLRLPSHPHSATRKVLKALGYGVWLNDLSQPIKVVPDRYCAWEHVSVSFSQRFIDSVVVVELGVAHGYSTRKLLAIFGHKSRLRIEAFDSFRGLPEAWNGYPAGTFSRSGNPPDLIDDRVRFHVGLVEESINDESVEAIFVGSHARFVLFDLDLLSPSVWCARHIAPHLRHGDFVYFDELLDHAEQTAKAVLDLGLIDRDLRLMLVCATSLSALFEVRNNSTVPQRVPISED